MTSNGHHRMPVSAFREIADLLQTDTHYRRLQNKADNLLAKIVRLELEKHRCRGLLQAAEVAAALACEKRERRRRELLNLLGQEV